MIALDTMHIEFGNNSFPSRVSIQAANHLIRQFDYQASDLVPEKSTHDLCYTASRGMSPLLSDMASRIPSG